MSYFNAPVRVSTFMAAVNGLVERLIRIAGRTEQVRIQVIWTGTQACAVWTCQRNTINGSIKLPALKEGSVIDRHKANVWVGYVIHEVWHIIFTDANAWQAFCRGAHDGSRIPSFLLRMLANAMEDCRIERSGLELKYAEGFNIVGRDLLAHMMQEGGMDVNPNEPGNIPWVFAVGGRAYGVPGEKRLLSRLHPAIRKILDEAKRQVDAIPARVSSMDGTMRSIAIARWIVSELKKLSTYKEPPPPPPPPEPPEPEEEGEGGEGEGEPGEGDDDGDTDGPVGPGKGKGDRPPPPLKVGDKVECPDGMIGRIVEINGDDAKVDPL